MKYYYKIFLLLWSLPVKLRLEDIKTLADSVAEMRISDEEVEEYVDHLKTHIDIEDVVD